MTRAEQAAIIRPGAGSGAPAELTVLGDDLYLRADDGIKGSELWRFDGTAWTLLTPTGAAPSPRSRLGGEGLAAAPVIRINGRVCTTRASTGVSLPLDLAWIPAAVTPCGAPCRATSRCSRSCGASLRAT